MPNWYYDKADLKRTPSNLDSLDYETEQRYRREGARFIINVGTTMGLRYDTMATGVVYFHRFYMSHSFRTFPRYVTACCCLFLAGKVEETPKKCKDIIKTARTLLTDKSFAQFGEDPKEEVMTLERILLQTIKFDLQVDHPYSYLLKYAKSLRGDKTKVQKLVQMAWTFVNDSLCTTLCLQWEPEIIAIALMYLACKLSKFEVLDWSGRTSKHSRWWDMFVEDMSVELLDDICHQVLDLYSTPISNTPKDSPPSSPPLTSVKGRPPTPLPTGPKPTSPVKAEAAAATPVTPGPAVVPTTAAAVIPVVAATPVALTPPPAPPVRPPTAAPVPMVGHPIPCLEEGVVKGPLPPPPPAKITLSTASDGHAKAPATAQPPLVSPIPSITPVKFNYPQSTSKPTTPTPTHQAPSAKEEAYPYVPSPPLPPPPRPPFQQAVFRDSPNKSHMELTLGHTGNSHSIMPGQSHLRLSTTVGKRIINHTMVRVQVVLFHLVLQADHTQMHMALDHLVQQLQFVQVLCQDHLDTHHQVRCLQDNHLRVMDLQAMHHIVMSLKVIRHRVCCLRDMGHLVTCLKVTDLRFMALLAIYHLVRHHQFMDHHMFQVICHQVTFLPQFVDLKHTRRDHLKKSQDHTLGDNRFLQDLANPQTRVRHSITMALNLQHRLIRLPLASPLCE